MISRREARERVLQALYAYELGGGSAEHHIKTLIDPDLKKVPAMRRFAVSLLLRTLDRYEASSALIEKHANNWALNRIALVDRLLLQMGIVELQTFEDVPPKVTINESIEIAKLYSTEESGRFINGILDAILEEMKRDGTLRKTGRGLIGMDDLGAATGSSEA